MKKSDILKALEKVGTTKAENIVAAELVRNIQVFGDEVIVDAESISPTLQAKKKLEVDIMKAIHDEVNVKAKVVVNITVSEKAKEEANNVIKGAPIPGVQNIIAIASGKGGVGKSTVTANLAIALKKMGFKVGLIDADIYGPSAPLMFDIQHAKPITVNVDGKNKMGPVDGYGVKIMSIGFFANMDQAVVWRGAMATKALTQMIHDTHWGELDFLLIDLPPGTGDIQISLAQQVKLAGAVIVSTPQDIALLDVVKALTMFEKADVPVLGMIENMASWQCPDCGRTDHIFGDGGAAREAGKRGIELLGQIPLSLAVRSGSDAGTPIVVAEPQSPQAKTYRDIAKKLMTIADIRYEDSA